MDEILAAAARAAWVSAWADAAEEQGHSYGGGCDLMDVAPETPKRALDFARRWAAMFQKFNGIDLAQAFERARAMPGKHRKAPTADDFGHYSMMQSLGHGVAWCDDHPRHGFKLPYVEFHVYDDGNGYECEFSVCDRVGLATEG